MSTKKLKVAIIGTGNIGTDLLIKLGRSSLLECTLFTGRSPDSGGIQFAAKMGVATSFESIGAIESDPGCCDVVFDATSAQSHKYHAPILSKLGKFVVDLTPSRIGKMCVPVINVQDVLDCCNVNLVTCGGQASVPIAYAIHKVHPEVSYIELVASISSKSAGQGTRANIDEYTQTTKDAVLHFSNVPKAKAIIILNPAEPPIIMRNTIYAVIKDPNIPALEKEICLMAEKIRQYVPGYKVVLGPIREDNRVTTTVEVNGNGDYLPKYSGNLDIITCAAIEVAEQYARRKLSV